MEGVAAEKVLQQVDPQFCFYNRLDQTFRQNHEQLKQWNQA